MCLVQYIKILITDCQSLSPKIIPLLKIYYSLRIEPY